MSHDGKRLPMLAVDAAEGPEPAGVPLGMTFLHCGNVSMSDAKDADEKNIFYVPMGLFSLAHEAQASGASVEIVHSDLQAGVPLAHVLDLATTDAVGFDLHWINQALVVMETAAALKRLAPHIFTFVGGFSASYFAEEIVREFPQIDGVIRGDAERPIGELVKALRRAKAGAANGGGARDEHLRHVANLVWRRDDQSVDTTPFNYVVTHDDLDRFHYTDFGLMRDWEVYRHLSRFWTHYAPFADAPLFFLQPARGCRYNCTFCGGNARAQSIINARRGVTFRSPQSCLTTIRDALAKGFGTIYTSMEDADSDEWYGRLLEEIRGDALSLNYVYGCWRLPSERLVDQLSATARHVVLEISPESGVEDIRLKNRDRRLFYTNEQMFERLSYIRTKGNVFVQLYFGFYNAYDTLDSIDDTIRLVLDLVCRFPGFVEVSYSAFSTDPGSLLQINPTRYDVDMAPKCLKDYVQYLRRNYVEEKRHEVEMTLFRPIGVTPEADVAIRRRIAVVRGLFAGFRRTTSYLLSTPGGRDAVIELVSSSPATGSVMDAAEPARLMRGLATTAYRTGRAGREFEAVLSRDYAELLARPPQLRPTSFFFLDTDFAGAGEIHADVARYLAFLEDVGRGASLCPTALAAGLDLAVAAWYEHAHQYWSARSESLRDRVVHAMIGGETAAAIDVTVTGDVLAMDDADRARATDEGARALLAAALAVVTTRYMRGTAGPVWVSGDGPPVPLAWAAPLDDAMQASALVAFVGDELARAREYGGYLSAGAARDGVPASRVRLLVTPGATSGGIDAGVLALSLTVEQGHLALRAVASQPLPVDRRRLERMLGWVVRAMQWLLSHPAAPVRELGLLTDDESRTARALLSGPRVEAPSRSFVALFADVVAVHAARAAVSSDDATWSYAELDAAANRVARMLAAAGVMPGSRVGVALTTTHRLAAVLLGVLKAGAAFVPIDRAAPPARQRFVVEDAGIEVVVDDGESALAGDPRVRALRFDGLAAYSDAAPDVDVTPDALAYVIYTSGSTGAPKGVEVAHASLVNFCRWRVAAYDMAPTDTVLSVLSYCFDGFASSFFPTLLAGGQVRLVPDERRRDVPLICEAVERDGVTNLALVPAHFEALAGVDDVRQFHSLRFIVIGGDKVTPARLAAFRARFPHVRVINEYGPTETTIACIVNTQLDAAAPFDVGRPIANTEAFVLDAAGQVAPAGFPGELWIAGAGVARGYAGGAAGSPSGFVAHPFDAGRRAYRTGDVAVWTEDGRVEIMGRTDGQLKIRGHRIDVGEVEHAMLAHAQVEEAAVVPLLAEGRPAALAAYYTATGALDSAVLRAALAERLPAFMLPEHLERLDTMPRTTGGKSDRRALAARAAASTSAAAAAPISGRADAILDAIAAALHVDVGMLDPEKSFVQLGGHSITLITLQHDLARQQGLDVSFLDMLSAHTIGDLLACIERARRTPAPHQNGRRVVRLRPGSRRRALFMVHDVSGRVAVYDGLARTLRADHDCWGLQMPAAGRIGPSELVLAHLAGAYGRDIVARSAGRSISLCGWSLGGALALEVAAQLELTGVALESVVLIDPPAPYDGPMPPPLEMTAERAWIAEQVRLDGTADLVPAEADTPEAAWQAVASGLAARGVAPHALLAAIPADITRIIGKYRHPDVASVLRQVNVVRSLVHAWQRHAPARPRPLRCPVTLVRPSVGDVDETRWRDVADVVRTATVHGDHWTMFLPEHADGLAEAVDAALTYRDTGPAVEPEPVESPVLASR